MLSIELDWQPFLSNQSIKSQLLKVSIALSKTHFTTMNEFQCYIIIHIRLCTYVRVYVCTPAPTQLQYINTLCQQRSVNIVSRPTDPIAWPCKLITMHAHWYMLAPLMSSNIKGASIQHQSFNAPLIQDRTCTSQLYTLCVTFSVCMHTHQICLLTSALCKFQSHVFLIIIFVNAVIPDQVCIDCFPHHVQNLSNRCP